MNVGSTMEYTSLEPKALLSAMTPAGNISTEDALSARNMHMASLAVAL